MKAMNILLLSNGAPNYHHFFNALAQRFHADGASVAIAVDSNFSRDRNQLDALGFPIHDFCTFFASHVTDPGILRKYADQNLNAALLSDFERAQVYGVWGIKERDYCDRLKSALLSYYEDIFRQHSIELVLYENVSNSFAHFALFVAQRHGARYCGIGGSRLPGRFSVTSDPLRDDQPQKIFEEIRSGRREIPEDVKAWCEDYLSKIETVTPDYMKINGLDNTSLVKKYAQLSRFKTIATLLKHLGDDSYHAFQIGNPLRTYLNHFRRNIGRRCKLWTLRNYYDAVPADGSEQFLLYPMHFHPESSTSILAGTYLDEYEVIRNIAFNLPEGLKLYVKDHISAVGYPSLDFYRKLKKLPNVRVLAPHAPTKQLIKKSAAVITLTSTMGYEAVLLDKKVFLFGDVFYKYHQNIVAIENPRQIFPVLKMHLAEMVKPDKDYNIQFIASYYLSTNAGALNLMLSGVPAMEMANKVYLELLNAFASESSGHRQDVSFIGIAAKA